MEEKKYKLTVGLEIHAELKTQTKMFCDSKNDPDEARPNVNICPVCMGHPGTLPVINKEAVRHVLKVGKAIGGKFADFTEFDRKNYFYPDIPKGYQLSQYKYPLVSGGEVNGVKITRVHLEEDTATSLHEKGDYSLVDFNRAGVPLMELVTEPVIKSSKEAGDFARELQLLLRYLGVSDANMEKGEMRVEANISISEKEGIFGTKVEVKNINSFRAVERAIEYEINRQTGVLEAGEKVVQETRGWNDTKQETYSQRKKEESHDYRYFPDPDLPKLLLSEIPEFQLETLVLGELPWQVRTRFERDFKITGDAARIFIEYRQAANFLELVAAILKDASKISLAVNYITSDLVGLVKNSGDVEKEFKNLKFSSKDFSELIEMIQRKELSSRGAKDILSIMYKEGGEPNSVASKHGLIQKNDEGELRKIVQSLIDANAKVVLDYKGGKETALQFLVGQGMKASKGSANPELLKSIIKSMIV
ncbi:MAG: Asp-tRNA(Asn)/Glu-tRNA(Gln) amidotransferase subunit GatB [Candidatus Taylorbacteria bacterium]|nr:Asp-tRNA(Asn)/Glu-tRNA(Gln) amidotransferase subunit GatB [Candidatus Taylorbacteria bacterium]